MTREQIEASNKNRSKGWDSVTCEEYRSGIRFLYRESGQWCPPLYCYTKEQLWSIYLDMKRA